MNENRPTIVVFDTDCILCSTWVQFLLRHERCEAFWFASSRKPAGQTLAAEYGFLPEALDMTYLVVCDGQALTKSDASLFLLSELRAPWRWFNLLRLLLDTYYCSNRKSPEDAGRSRIEPYK